MNSKITTLLCVAALSLPMSACTAMKIPDFAKGGSTEFEQEAQNLGGYPDVADAPDKPKGLKSDKQWDLAAQKVIDARDNFGAPGANDAQTEREIVREMQALSDAVDEYMKDDPQ